jgi:hypothetical protein
VVKHGQDLDCLHICITFHNMNTLLHT